ncbi:MAG: hypothetical protein ACI8Z1_001376 [Candidatus Azotimanducaceae bacterium]|jgi:hypothetical protein
MNRDNKMEVHGYCDEKFSRVREEFEKNLSEHGDERSVSLSRTLYEVI